MSVGLKLNKVAALSAMTMVGLAGCSFSASTSTKSVPVETVVSTAEDLLEQEAGQPAIVDCGTEDFKFVEGETRDCVVTTDPPGPDKYEAVITLKNVDDSDDSYTVAIEVADEPMS